MDLRGILLREGRGGERVKNWTEKWKGKGKEEGKREGRKLLLRI